jgi:hypothetical protein
MNYETTTNAANGNKDRAARAAAAQHAREAAAAANDDGYDAGLVHEHGWARTSNERQ